MKIDLNQVSEDPQVVADLEEYVGLLINGMPVDQAIAQVWPQARPRQYASDVNGVVIGWDTCGTCGKHVTRCKCPSGPYEPRFFNKLREDEARRSALAAGADPLAADRAASKARTDVGNTVAGAPAHSDQGSSTSQPTEESPSATGQSSPQTTSDASGSSASTSMVPCKPGQHLVPVDTAERNDDGSWTCFEHQATAALRDGTGDE